MNALNPKQLWEAYCSTELLLLTPILTKYHITLDDEQKHISGERYLMQAVTTTSGKKLILTGTRSDGSKVIIKATRDSSGKQEIEHERECRSILHSMDFAAEVFHSPHEILYTKENSFLITVTEFIDQQQTFIERTTPEQFNLALRAFKGQEGAHATTSKHLRLISKTFEVRGVDDYFRMFNSFKNTTVAAGIYPDTVTLLNRAQTMLQNNRTIIDQYTGFLTHTDLVPHNMRIRDGVIYLLDHSSLTFGNKYEGWARFLNFMTLYNPELEHALVCYVKDNRTSEESISLQMMRIYRLGEIISYYIRATEKSVHDLKKLNERRILFWSDVLIHILENKQVPESIINEYQQSRDALRSDDEKKRQQGLH